MRTEFSERRIEMNFRGRPSNGQNRSDSFAPGRGDDAARSTVAFDGKMPAAAKDAAAGNRIQELAVSVGAALAAPITGRELVAFEVMRGGDIAVEIADGSKFTIASRRHARETVVPSDIATAEDFLQIMGRHAALPIGARPEGRRFIRRTAIAADGKSCVKFSEAGRDV
jgi:hypothetical protein